MIQVEWYSWWCCISYLAEYFTVEWNQVRLQDSPKDGPFTFQTTLYRNGTIVFVYKTIPIPVGAINDTHHPVKVGLSDAYIKDKNMLCEYGFKPQISS